MDDQPPRPYEQKWRENFELFGNDWPIRNLRLYYGGSWRETSLIHASWSHLDYLNGSCVSIKKVNGDYCGLPSIEDMVRKKVPNPLKYELCLGDTYPVYTLGGVRMEVEGDSDFGLFWNEGDNDSDGYLALFIDLMVVVPEDLLLDPEEVYASMQAENTVAANGDESEVLEEGGNVKKNRRKHKSAKRPIRKMTLRELKKKSKSQTVDIGNLSEEELDDMPDILDDEPEPQEFTTQPPTASTQDSPTTTTTSPIHPPSNDPPQPENENEADAENENEEEEENESENEEVNEEEQEMDGVVDSSDSDDELSEDEEYDSPGSSSDEDYVPTEADKQLNLDDLDVEGELEGVLVEEDDPDNDNINDEFIDETDDVFVDEREEVQMPVVPDIPVKGTVWPTIQECRAWLRDYAVNTNMEYRYHKNDPDRIRAVCLTYWNGGECPWYFSSGVNTGVKGDKTTCKCHTFNPQHGYDCFAPEEFVNSMIDAQWVAQKMEAEVRVHYQTFKAREIIRAVWAKYAHHISYYTAWHARCKIMEKIHGNYEASYSIAPSLCAQMHLRNPGGVATIARHPTDERFENLCIAFNATIKGWVEGCRPMIGLDGCHLKGKYGGILLSITALDGNNGLYPLAVYICRSEGYQSWKDFLEIMQPHLAQHQRELTIISDQQKGLQSVIAEVFPTAFKRFCFRHMYQNFKKDCKGGCHHEKLVWNAARAYRESDKKYWMEKIKEKSSQCYDWLVARNEDTFCRSRFPYYSKCEHITNNFSESFNKWILRIREKPVATLVEDLVIMMMAMMRKRQIKAQSMDPNGIVPRARKVIDKHLKKIQDYTYSSAEDNKFLVLSYTGSRWLVDLGAKTCECRAWQLTGIPCVHAVIVIAHKRQDWSKMCSEYLSVKNYKLAYSRSVLPLPDQGDWDIPSITVKPPPHQRPPGRPRKNRKRGVDEAAPTGSQAWTTKRTNNCTRCKLPGHNKASCKGLSAEQMLMQRRSEQQGEGGSRGRGRGGRAGRGGRGRGESGDENIVSEGLGQPPIGRGRGRGGRGRGGRGGRGRGGRGRGGRGEGGDGNIVSEGIEQPAVARGSGRGGRGRGEGGDGNNVSEGLEQPPIGRGRGRGGRGRGGRGRGGRGEGGDGNINVGAKGQASGQKRGPTEGDPIRASQGSGEPTCPIKKMKRGQESQATTSHARQPAKAAPKAVPTYSGFIPAWK